MTQTDSKTPRGDREELQVASGDTMKAIVYTHYGSPDVLQLNEVARPTPRDNEVLVQVHAVSVNAGDLHVLRADPFLIRLMGYGLLKPKNKILGAEVTAVCSTRNVDIMRSLGADHVIDYTGEDFTQNGQQYDLIVAANGNRSISEYQRALRPNGTYVMTGGSEKQMFQAMLLGPWISMIGTKKMGNVMAKPNTRDLGFVKEPLEEGLVIPVIDRRYPLGETAEALRYVDQGHTQGKVVITVEQNTHIE